MALPIIAESKEDAEQRLEVPIQWQYEPRKRLPGLRRHFNHDGRWVGLTNGGYFCLALVYDNPEDAARDTPSI